MRSGKSLQIAGSCLMSYRVVAANQYQRAAFYVDRILRGANPNDLPVRSTRPSDQRRRHTAMLDLASADVVVKFAHTR